MKENQKDTLATGSQSQQAQSNQYGSNPTKVGTPSPKQGARDEEDEEEEENPQAGVKQYDSKEQRDGKTSQQETQNRRDEDQRKTQGQPAEQKSQNGQQTAEQKKR